MITENEYLEAKKVVEKYEQQQQLKIERKQNGDIDLLTVLSERPKNLLIAHNEECPEGEELIYISDVVKYIKKDGFSAYGNKKERKHILQYCLIKWGGMGYKSYDEIMLYVYPFL
jgi:hypothetical protein